MSVAGRLLLIGAALASAAAGGWYLRGHRRERAGLGAGNLRPARFLFCLHTGLIEIAAALLLSAILTHRFDLAYVFNHSSTDLPFGYLVSTFWAGQEGTFLLWALYGAVIGCALVARTGSWEPAVVGVWSGLQTALVGLLLVQSPFAATDLAGFSAGDRHLFATLFAGLPPEGQGLNPLLQNPWMVIHPPILFLGFCAMGLPFTYAVAGLLRGEAEGWTWRAQGWTLLAWGILGTGLVLGGYWAYETLGWGGYWAWDPVENSSLVPWLLAGALFHGFLLQRHGGAGQRLNVFLAVLAFTAVTAGSYLNRSGALSDFSVHSFVALSPSFNRALIVFAVLPPAVFAAVWPAGRRCLTRVPLDGDPLARRRLLHQVTLLLAGSGLLVLVANAWPLLSGLLSRVSALQGVVPQAASLQPEFYNRCHVPVAMVMAVLLAALMGCDWERCDRAKLRAWLVVPAAAGLAAAVVGGWAVAVWLAGRSAHPEQVRATAKPLAAAWVSLVALSAGAAVSNGRLIVARLRAGRTMSIGVHLAHTGFMILIIGVVVSSVYETKAMVSLPLHQPVGFAGYELTYRGLNPVGHNAEILVAVERGQSITMIRPVLRPGRDGVIRNPGILKSLAHDLYLEPGEIKPGQRPDELILERGVPARLDDLTFELLTFDLGDGEMDPNDFRVGVELRVTREQTSAVVKPWFAIRDGRLTPTPAPLPGGGTVSVVDIPAKGKTADRVLILSVQGRSLRSTPETAVMQITVKPLMSVFWLGCWLTLSGGLLASARRLADAARRLADEHPLVQLAQGTQPAVTAPKRGRTPFPGEGEPG